jgi:hypothetical protein
MVSEVHPTRPKSTSVANMQQSRRVCMALYFEDEYEKLVMEAHFDCKQPNNPIDNRLSFQCKFYKVCMTAMNTISYHKMMN